jgi:uncharacterized membrane protein
MIIISLFASIATFVNENPWSTVALVFLIGLALPAVWSTHSYRRRAAIAVIRTMVNVIVAIAVAIHDSRRT